MPDAFDHLRLFRDIVDLNSVSHGAERNHITQSAASQQLREWERSFGRPLLDRATRPFTVTPAGRLYYEIARDVLARQEPFAAGLEGLKGDGQGLVRVAAVHAVRLFGNVELPS